MEFNELIELYDHLEVNVGEYKYDHNIADLFQKLRDLKHKNGQADDAEKAQWEIDCFNFVTKNGKLKPMFSGTDGQGQPFEYPSMSKLSEKELDYIEARLEATSHPIIRARYAHILWESPTKHKKYAEIAVDSYLILLKFFEEKDMSHPEAHYGLDVLKSIEQALFLAFSANYRVEDVRSEMSRLVKEFNFESSSAFVMRNRLIRHMLEGKGKFPIQSFVGFPEVCLILGQRLIKEGRFHQAIDIFQTAEKVDNKLGLMTYDWNRSIAESYEVLMHQRDESDLAATSFCQNAIEHYKKIGDQIKIQELEKRYEQLKGKQQFHKFSQTLDITGFRSHCRDIAQKLCSEEPEIILSVLIGDKGLLPTYKNMEELAEEFKKNAPFASIVPVAITDQYGHTAEHFSTDEEKRYFGILQQYEFDIMLSKHFVINEIFLEALKQEKLNIWTIMDFFQKNSWYGKNITKSAPSNQTLTYNWLNLIAPSINEYFIQMKAHLSQPEYAPNMVLAMDSLVLKIEGLVRDICAFSGITTFYQTKDKQGRIIIREKDINWLLREEPIKKLFDEDDLLFFKYVLVEKAGLNLRHKIAHCLMDYSNYNVLYMHLLILVLFKLGRYDFVRSDETVEEKVEEIN